MNKKQPGRSRSTAPVRPVPAPSPSDADRLAQGLPLESGEAQPRSVRRLH